MAKFDIEFRSKLNNPETHLEARPEDLKSTRDQIIQRITALELKQGRKLNDAELREVMVSIFGVGSDNGRDAQRLYRYESVSKQSELGPVLTRLALLVGLFVKPGPTIEQGSEGENDYVDLLEEAYKTRAKKYGVAWAKAYYLRDLVYSLWPAGRWLLHRLAFWETIKRVFY